MVIFIVVLSAFITAFSVIGIILKFYRSLNTRQQYFHQQTENLLSHHTNFLYGVALFGLLTLIIGLNFLAKTYYDYLSLNLLMGSLFIVWGFIACGLMIVGIVAPSFVFYYENIKEGVFFQFSFLFLLFATILFLVFLVFPRGVETYKGLSTGPQWGSGIVERKSTGFSRAGPAYYISVNGENKRVPEAAWWFSLKRGDEIQYAYNPHATISSPVFRPDSITITVPGAILIMIGLLPWLLTIWLAGYEFAISIRPKKIAGSAFQFTEYKSGSMSQYPNMASTDTLDRASSEQTFPKVFLLGLGIAVGIFFAFRKLIQLKDNSDNLKT